MSRNDPRNTNESKLAQMRKAKNMTQAQLAEKVGCTQKDISRWEKGHHSPNVRWLLPLATALGCSTDDLL